MVTLTLVTMDTPMVTATVTHALTTGRILRHPTQKPSRTNAGHQLLSDKFM